MGRLDRLRRGRGLSGRGQTLSGVVVSGAHFGPDTQLDFGPDIILEQVRVLDDGTMEIGSLRVARSLVGRAEGLFAVRVPGCGCAVEGSQAAACWLLAAVFWLGWRRRINGCKLS